MFGRMLMPKQDLLIGCLLSRNKNFIKENPTAIAVGFLYAFEAVLFKYGNCIAYGFFVSFHAILVNF